MALWCHFKDASGVADRSWTTFPGGEEKEELIGTASAQDIGSNHPGPGENDHVATSRPAILCGDTQDD